MFQINSRLDYGLILLRSLALHYDEGLRPLKTIADENRLPYRYLAQIVMPLKNAGIVRGREGARGGYRLGRKPGMITLQEVTLILSPRKRLNRCLLTDHRVCKLKEGCSMSEWWFRFNERFQKLIRNMTLEDLI